MLPVAHTPPSSAENQRAFRHLLPAAPRSHNAKKGGRMGRPSPVCAGLPALVSPVARFDMPGRSRVYCNSFVTSCCMLLAWARAEMPVCDRISYLDMLEVADA